MTSPNDRGRIVSHVVRATSLAVAIASAATLIACASAPRREDVCLGERYVEVQNHTGEPVDLYVVSGGLSRLVTTVSTGRSELPLPSETEAGAWYRGRRTKDGRWINTGHTRPNSTDRFTIQVKCDTPRP